MTKIFALNPEMKEGEEKVKQVDSGGTVVSPAVLQPAFFPITLPISSIVAKKKKCRLTHLIILLLLLWAIVSITLVFHLIPDSFYRRMNHFVDNRAERFISNQGNYIERSQNGGIKSDDAVPSRFETMKAITNLLKIPGVQQVAVLQSNDRMLGSDNRKQPVGISPLLSSQPQSVAAENFNEIRAPSASQMQINEWALINYHRAMREWLMRREMFRRRLMIELEREREVAAAAERGMPRFMMGMPRPQPLMPWHRVPVMPVMMWNDRAPPMIAPMVQHVPPPMVMQSNMYMVPSNVMTSRVLPVHPFKFFPQQQQMMHFPVIPQQQIQENEKEPIQQNEIDPIVQSITTQLHDGINGRFDGKQEKESVMVQQTQVTSEVTPDRDAIFKVLRSRAQMQLQQQQASGPSTQHPQSVVPLIPPRAPGLIQYKQRNPDDIFRELQQRALRMQLEQDQREAEEKNANANRVDGDTPVLMNADTFPIRAVTVVSEDKSEEIAETTITTTTTEANNGMVKDSRNSSEALRTYFKFFDDETHKSEENHSPNKQDNIGINNLKQSSESSDLWEADTDKNEPVMKLDITVPQVDFEQDVATTLPLAKEKSEEAQGELATEEISQNKISDTPPDSELIPNASLLETSRITVV